MRSRNISRWIYFALFVIYIGLVSCSEDPEEIATLEPPATPTQISPGDGTIFNNYPRTATFTWSTVSGTDVSYGIQIEAWIPSIGGGGSWIHWRSDTLQTISYDMDNFIGAQSGHWRVWAFNSVGSSDKTVWWSFSFSQ